MGRKFAFQQGMKTAIFFILSLLGVYASAGNIIPSADPFFPVLGALVGENKAAGGTDTYACTGTLISNHQILTAAHCLFNKKGNVHEHLSFILTSQITSWTQAGNPEGKKLKVGAIYLFNDWVKPNPPKYDANPALQAAVNTFYQLKYDLAIAELATPITENLNFPALTTFQRSNNDYCFIGFPEINSRRAGDTEKTCAPVASNSFYEQYLPESTLLKTTDSHEIQSGGPVLNDRDELIGVLRGIATLSGGRSATQVTTISDAYHTELNYWLGGTEGPMSRKIKLKD